MSASPPDPTVPVSAAPPINMAEKIANLVERVAQSIEDQLGGLSAIHSVGGPYEHSLAIAYERKLRAAAASAIETIVTDPDLRPTE